MVILAIGMTRVALMRLVIIMSVVGVMITDNTVLCS